MSNFSKKLIIFAICTDLARPFLIDLDKKIPVINDIRENNIRLNKVFVGNQTAKWVTACPIYTDSLASFVLINNQWAINFVLIIKYFHL